jgi:hypothetical protein
VQAPFDHKEIISNNADVIFVILFVSPWRILCSPVFDEYRKSESENKFKMYTFFLLFVFTFNKNNLHINVTASVV